MQRSRARRNSLVLFSWSRERLAIKAAISSANSMICRSVTATSRLLINRERVVFHAFQYFGVQLWTEIDAISENVSELVPVIEILQTNAAQGARHKLCEDIDLARC